MENLKAILHKGRLDFSDAVQTRIYVTIMSEWDTINGILNQYFNDSYPARTAFEVAGLPSDTLGEDREIAQARHLKPLSLRKGMVRI